MRISIYQKALMQLCVFMLVATLFLPGHFALAKSDSDFYNPITRVANTISVKQHAVAAKIDGTVWSWGFNNYGQLGDGSNVTYRTFPVRVPSLETVGMVATGSFHSLALKSDGTVWSWGRNFNGQLGDGAQANSNIPLQVKGLEHIIAIAAGGSHSVALKDDGTVWTWGSNSYGELGDGTTSDKYMPSQVPGLNGVTQITASLVTTMVVKSDGTVWVWGSNLQGKYGNGTTDSSEVPVQIPRLNEVSKIEHGASQAFAVKKDGTVWGWGQNSFGQLGDGTSNNRLEPIELTGLGGVRKIAAGNTFTYALKQDGSVWAWGANARGQLGDGTLENRLSPVRVAGLSDVEEVYAGQATGMAVSHNSFYSWGSNASGVMGTSAVDYQYSSTIKQFQMADKEDLIVPSTPGNFRIVKTTPDSITLAWDPSTDNIGVSEYNIFGGYYDLKGTVPGNETQIVMRGLTPLTQYSFYIGARDAAGNASEVRGIYGTTLEGEPPSAPSELAVTGKTAHSISLTWKSSSDNVGVTQYDIYQNGVLVGNSPTNNYTATGLSDWTAYSFTVKAKDAAGNESAMSLIKTEATLDGTAPSVPTGLRAERVGSNALDLTWNASTDNVGVESYEVFKGAERVGSSTTTSFRVSGLSQLSAYSFTVTAKDAQGNASAGSPAVKVTTTDGEAPTTPSRITATSTTATSVTLEWPASTDNVGVSGYEIYKDGLLLGTSNVNKYKVTGLNQLTEYAFTIKALDTAGNKSQESAALRVTTMDGIAPSVPTKLAVASVIGPTGVRLTWVPSSDNVGVTGYDVYRDGVFVGVSTDNAYTVTGLTQLTAYSFTVRARDAAGNVSDASDPVTATTLDGIPPTVPTNLTVAGKTANTVSLSWTASVDNVGVQSYDIYQNGILVGNSLTASFTITGLSQLTGYLFAVQAKDNVGNVSRSAELNVTTMDGLAPTVPTGLIAVNKTAATVSLAWSPSSDNVGVVAYDIYKNNQFIGSASTTNYVVTGLDQLTGYTFAVKARDAVGNVSASANLDVTTQDGLAPSKPANVNVSAKSLTTIHLSWGSSTDNVGVSRYDIYNGSTLVGSTTTTSYIVTGLSQQTNYTFTVKAVDAAGNVSLPSDAITAATLDGGIILPPPFIPKDTYESNDTTSTATPIQVGSAKASYISTTGDKDFYTITAPATGQLTLSLVVPVGIGKNFDLAVFGANGTSELASSKSGTDINESITLPVKEGNVYYIKVYGSTSSDYADSSYTLRVSELNKDLNEPNDSKDTAAPIEFNRVKTGYISSNSDRDFFKLTTKSQQGKVNVKLKAPSQGGYRLRIYNEEGNELTGIDNNSVFFAVLPNQTYYLEVSAYAGANDQGSYDLEVSSISQYGEPNDTHLAANGIFPGSSVQEYISSKEDVDFYTFTADRTGKVEVQLSTAQGLNYELVVYRGEGNRLSTFAPNSTDLKKTSFDVKKGEVYYVKISAASGSEASTTVPYTLWVSNIYADDEPNDTYTTAMPISVGQSLQSYLSVQGDKDFYVLDTGGFSGVIRVKLIVPAASAKDYDIQVFNGSGNKLKRDNNYAGVPENFTFTASSRSKYYFKVYGAADTDYGTQPYTLSLTAEGS